MPLTEAVFTLATRGRFLTSASKFNIESNGRILTSVQKKTVNAVSIDVSAGHDV